MPRIIIRRLLEVTTRNLNSFPAEHGISDLLSPLSMSEGVPPPDAQPHPFGFGVDTEIFKDNG